MYIVQYRQYLGERRIFADYRVLVPVERFFSVIPVCDLWHQNTKVFSGCKFIYIFKTEIWYTVTVLKSKRAYTVPVCSMFVRLFSFNSSAPFLILHSNFPRDHPKIKSFLTMLTSLSGLKNFLSCLGLRCTEQLVSSLPKWPSYTPWQRGPPVQC